MERKKLIRYQFDGWITIELPETWIYEQEEDILNIYSNVNPKSAIQISFFNISLDISREEIANNFIDKFIKQFGIEVDINTKMVIERDDYSISIVSGISEGRFIKIWCLAENKRALLITYNSLKKTREVGIADDIVYGIKFI